MIRKVSKSVLPAIIWLADSFMCYIYSSVLPCIWHYILIDRRCLVIDGLESQRHIFFPNTSPVFKLSASYDEKTNTLNLEAVIESKMTEFIASTFGINKEKTNSIHKTNDANFNDVFFIYYWNVQNIFLWIPHLLQWHL